MIKSLLVNEPIYLILLIPFFLSLLTTSNTNLYLLNASIILFFCFSHLYFDYSYLDAWVFVIILVLSYLYRKKEKIGELVKFKDAVYFTGIEKYVYDRDFKLLLTEEEFRLFIDIAQMKKNKDNLNLAVEGEKIEKIIYIATIPAYRSLILKSNETIISYLHEGSWLGRYILK